MTLDREHLELTVPDDDRIPVYEPQPVRHRGCGVSVIPWLVLAVVVWRVGL